MFFGKNKAVTFSYDDGVTQDIRLASLFAKYGLKATFNINSRLLGLPGSLVCDGVQVNHSKVTPLDVKAIYDGHEVAGHTLTHPQLPLISDDTEIIRQVEEDRVCLSELVGYDVRGFAYPGGGINNDERVAKIIKENTGVRYCRTITSSGCFDLQENLYQFKPTVYHYEEFDKLFKLGEKFLNLEDDKPAVFYIWGHAYEFDIADTWGIFEEFLQMISGKSDIFYGTNSEILLAK